MKPLQERFAERMSIVATEWRGARVQVTIEVPKRNNSMTTQIVIDASDLDLLRYLKPGDELEMMLDVKPDLARYRLMEYEKKRQMAVRLVEQIAGTIANQITRAIGED